MTLLSLLHAVTTSRLRNVKYEYGLVGPNNSSKRRQLRLYPTWLFLGLSIFMLMVSTSYSYSGDTRYKRAVEKAVKNPNSKGYSGNGEKVFIAAMFYNNEPILPYWTSQMLRVVDYLGKENAFISIVESNSGDNTAIMLQGFDAELKLRDIPHRIIVHDKSIARPESMETKEPRIRFLSSVRNKVLEPLVQNGGYDRVLFSNDVFVEAESVVELLKTRNGDYDFVCGLDLSYWALYDAWVIRDKLGRLVSSLWPYLPQDAGKEDIMRDEPSEVFTCWNGIVAFRSDPLLPVYLRSSYLTNRTSPLVRPLPESHPAFPKYATYSPAKMPPLRFRTSVETKECFSSEAFLFPYDLRRQFEMNKIFINPRVITSYDWPFYVWYKWFLRHWVVRFWMRFGEGGDPVAMENGKMIIGNKANVWTWDGGECQPWW
ncbi:cryptococcal mannosyltransferase 1-domain-containing protein [Mycena floridula]|nr:cryptococcal mannosyltransferase 1-domain-containing protein [Mycena floridula]